MFASDDLASLAFTAETPTTGKDAAVTCQIGGEDSRDTVSGAEVVTASGQPKALGMMDRGTFRFDPGTSRLTLRSHDGSERSFLARERESYFS